MTEYELQEQYCSRCDNPNCTNCCAFGEYMAHEIGWDEHDPTAIEDSIVEPKDYEP